MRYCRRAERKICKPNLVYLARIVDVKLGSVDDIQRMFSSRKEATGHLVRFRKHVEYDVGVNHKKQDSKEPRVLNTFLSTFKRKRILVSRTKFFQIKASLKVAFDCRSNW